MGRYLLVLTNGFSCREQIRHGTRREAIHLAQLLALAHARADAQTRVAGHAAARDGAVSSDLAEPG